MRNQTSKIQLAHEKMGLIELIFFEIAIVIFIMRIAVYAGRGLHGHQVNSEHRLRGWALLNNFRPFAPRSGSTRTFQSPAHRLNHRQYHQHWLHNLQVSSSCLGFRHPT